MYRYTASLLLSLSLSLPVLAQEPITVVVHPDNPLSSLSRADVSALFLGRYTSYPDGQTARPVDHAQDSSLRASFYEQLTGKPINKINAYWARLIFAGRIRPPKQVEGDQDVIQIVSNDIAAIGYVQGSVPTQNVKVVLTLP